MNNTIISNLEALLKEAQASKETKDKFRVRAYLNAIKEIKNCGYEIKSGKQALDLKGVGKKIAEKIQEIVDTGELHQVDKSDLEKTKVLSLFAKIWGVGPVRALELWEEGARTIQDVEEFYFELLNDNQKIGLKYFNDLQKRICRKEVEKISKIITNEIKIIQKKLKWNVKHKVCGSFRRKAKTCGDMDLLICEMSGEPILNKLVERLTKKGILIEQLGLGSTKYLGITKTSDDIAFRIDIEVIKPHEWVYAMLYFTGSGSFNEHQRLIAKKMGYSLSEHGLKDVKTGEYVMGIESEREIFDFLGMDYLTPSQRETFRK